MTSIGSITSQTASSSAADKTGLIQNYETFLTVLMTQLQHQDPMEPMDSGEFTQQLVQFSSVEQQIKSNEQLESLAEMMTASNALSVLNFVGTTVTIDGSQAYLDKFNDTSYSFTAETEGTADIYITNADGTVVYAQSDYAFSSGEQTFSWDGADESGNRMASGTYTINFDAKDMDGNAMTLSTDTSGVVTDVDLSSTVPLLMVNGQSIQTSQIKSVGIEAAS
ncbi:flagellar hook capping FlgD N-terminal domain-containing protein [uncultured Cohaesibacter sp.]|uniref:flagellar hook assembly protein FlgD n=1 Tax=uncultured Cohaesibacter sp. TaxID=1002546 RepID=UPI00292D7F31|nr:flagellar hook capping FlgD N-terminal domain-containing protein [uncultured Cohaesibacter sp.]